MALPTGAPFDIYKACCVQTWWRGHFAYITQKARARARETYISAILPPVEWCASMCEILSV